MRTFINTNTKINGFGLNQDRVIVTVRDGRSVRAAQHLASWHASLGLSLYHALKALAQAAPVRAALASPLQPALCAVSKRMPSKRPSRLSMSRSVIG